MEMGIEQLLEEWDNVLELSKRLNGEEKEAVFLLGASVLGKPKEETMKNRQRLQDITEKLNLGWDCV